MQKSINIPRVTALFIAFALSLPLQAKLSDFKDGPVITGFGKHAAVASNTVSKNTKLKVVFDVAKAGAPGEVNKRFDSLARFINMNVASGVLKENIQLALVVHGKASLDLLDHVTYQKAHKHDNPNKLLIQMLLTNNVRIILCGQSASAYDIALGQLITGSEIELSAMTAHALLQNDGYTVNPF